MNVQAFGHLRWTLAHLKSKVAIGKHGRKDLITSALQRVEKRWQAGTGKIRHIFFPYKVLKVILTRLAQF